VWRNGLHFYFRYDGDKTGARCIRTWGENNLLHYQLQYEQGVTHATNSLGHQTSYYHHAGLVYKKVNAEGAQWQTHYNEHTELVEQVDPLGNSTAYMYDEKGNLTTVIYPDNGVIQISYHPNGKPSSATDQMGGKWQWAYDGIGNLTRKTDPTGATIRYQYRKGLLHSITGANGETNILHYDFDYNLIGIDYGNELRETFLYDKLGRCTTATDIRGNNTMRQYDLLGSRVG